MDRVAAANNRFAQNDGRDVACRLSPLEWIAPEHRVVCRGRDARDLSLADRRHGGEASATFSQRVDRSAGVHAHCGFVTEFLQDLDHVPAHGAIAQPRVDRRREPP